MHTHTHNSSSSPLHPSPHLSLSLSLSLSSLGRRPGLLLGDQVWEFFTPKKRWGGMGHYILSNCPHCCCFSDWHTFLACVSLCVKDTEVASLLGHSWCDDSLCCAVGWVTSKAAQALRTQGIQMSLQTKRECPHHSRFILPSLLIALHPLVRSTQRLNQLVGCLSWRVSFQYLVICTSFSVRDSLRGLLR